jgi:hypothetical protein
LLVVGALAAVLAEPVAAHARPLVRVGTTSHAPLSAGPALVWQASGATMAIRPQRTGRVRHVALGPGCRLQDASPSGHVLVDCAPGGYVMSLATGRRFSVRVPPPQPGAIVVLDRIGANWVAGRTLIDCVHCVSFDYYDWRTGAVRSFDDLTVPEVDLDSPGLQRLPSGTVTRDPAAFLVDSTDVEVVVRRRRRVLGHCPALCDSRTLVKGRVTWIAHRADGPPVLHEHVLRSGRERAWTLRAGGHGLRHAIAARAGDALYVAVPTQSVPGTVRRPAGPYALFRAA